MRGEAHLGLEYSFLLASLRLEAPSGRTVIAPLFSAVGVRAALVSQ